MITPLNPAMAATEMPPVMEARRWLNGVTFSPERPNLLNDFQIALGGIQVAPVPREPH